MKPNDIHAAETAAVASLFFATPDVRAAIIDLLPQGSVRLERHRRIIKALSTGVTTDGELNNNEAFCATAGITQADLLEVYFSNEPVSAKAPVEELLTVLLESDRKQGLAITKWAVAITRLSELKTITADSDTPAYTTKNMNNLLTAVFEPIRWAVWYLLAEGLAILSGPPKIGKSWLALELCLAVIFGGYAFGKFKAEKGSVLLLAMEDNDRRLQDRLKKKFDGGGLENFHYQDQWRKLDQGGLDDLRHFLENHTDCRLVVIDTIQKIKAKTTSRGNAYETDYESFGALQRLALEFRCCILLIHHNRKTSSKGPDDALESISGSTGITGSMDTILMLTRARMQGMATLTVTGRDVEESLYPMAFDQTLCSWAVTEQSVEELSLKEDGVPAKVLQAIREIGGNATIQEVYEALEGEVKKDCLKVNIYRLKNKGQLRQVKNRFCIGGNTLTENVTDDTNVSNVTDVTNVTNPISNTGVTWSNMGMLPPQTQSASGFAGSSNKSNIHNTETPKTDVSNLPDFDLDGDGIPNFDIDFETEVQP